MTVWLAPADLGADDLADCAAHWSVCEAHFVCAGCGRVTHIAPVLVAGEDGVAPPKLRLDIYGDPPVCARCRREMRNK